MCCNKDNIINQISMEMYLNSIDVNKKSEKLMEEAIDTNINSWGPIISKIEEIYPYAAEKIDFMDLIGVLCSYIPYFNFKDSDIGVRDYIEEVSSIVAESFLTFIGEANSAIRNFEDNNYIENVAPFDEEEDD